MEISLWSNQMLHRLANPAQDELYSDPSHMPLFRSYRNLPSAVNGSNAARLPVQPSLPSPVLRSAYMASDYSPFMFQRSSSVRNPRSSHLGSVINLGEPSPVASNEVPNVLSGNVDSFSRLDQPQIGWIRSPFLRRERSVAARRIRNNANRYSVDAVDLLLPSLSELNQRVPTHAPASVLASSSFVHADLDANGASATEAAVNPTSSSNNTGTSGNNGSVNSWVQTHNQSGDPPSCPSVLRHNTSGDLQSANPAHDRVLLNRPSRLVYMIEEPTARDSTQDGITQRTSRLRPSHRQLTYRRAAFRQDPSDCLTQCVVSASPIITMPPVRPVDRPIHVRHPEVVVERRVRLNSDAQSSNNSISGASSVEDLPTGITMTPSGRNEQQPQRAIVVTVKEDDNLAISRTQRTISTPMNAPKEETPDDGDWRTNCSGTRELWRRLLLTERFADVYFYVGGTDILSSEVSSQITSPDPGAPGGPTSMKHYVSPQNHLRRRATGRKGHSTSPARTLSHDTGSTESIVSNTIRSRGSLDTEITDSTSDADEEVRILIGRSKTTDPAREFGHINSSSVVFPGLQSCHNLTGDLTTFGAQRITNNISSQSQIPGSSTSANRHPSLSESSIRDRSHSVNIQSDVEEPETIKESINHGGKTIDVQTRCTRFAAHRLVLSLASPVFEAMFYGPLASLDTQKTQQIPEFHIPDIHPKAFQILLLYIYADELQLGEDLDIVFYVLYASKKYILPQLGRRCVEHLKEHITAANVCTVLDRSIFFEEDDLTRRCWHVIDVMAPYVLTSPGLVKMDAERFKALLKRDTLNCKEAEVFAAVRRWAETECTRRGLGISITNQARVAAEFLRLVRFPTMALNEFAENVAYSGFLSLEMVRDLFVHITQQPNTSPVHRSKSNHQVSTINANGKDRGLNQNKTSAGESSKQDGHSGRATDVFSFVPRSGPKLWRCSRFSRTGKHSISTSSSNGQQHSLSFRVSTTIFLAGISVYGSTQVGERLSVRVELRTCNTKPITHRGSTSVATQFHGTSEQSDGLLRSVFPRASGLLEFTRHGRMDRSQSSRRSHNHNAETNVTATSGSQMRVPANNESAPDQGALESNDSKILAAVKSQVICDGTSRMYEIFFNCPVKVLRGERYILNVHTYHTSRPVLHSSTTTSMNAMTVYIGFFGRPEICVPCHSEESCEIGAPPGSANKGPSANGKRIESLKVHSTVRSQRQPKNAVIFQFWEAADGLEHGEVNRGFLPELLFYTCA